jgi:hypothetical protein
MAKPAKNIIERFVETKYAVAFGVACFGCCLYPVIFFIESKLGLYKDELSPWAISIVLAYFMGMHKMSLLKEAAAKRFIWMIAVAGCLAFSTLLLYLSLTLLPYFSTP